MTQIRLFDREAFACDNVELANKWLEENKDVFILDLKIDNNRVIIIYKEQD